VDLVPPEGIRSAGMERPSLLRDAEVRRLSFTGRHMITVPSPALTCAVSGAFRCGEDH
jgi:hypothetical protein